MNNAGKFWFVTVSVVVFASSMAGARTFSLIADRVHNLPTAPNPNQSVSGKYVHVKPYVAHDVGGHPINAPAYIIDIYTGALFWESPKPSEVPPFSFSIPRSLRGGIALYYSKKFGWVVVPRGWILASAGVGADGGGNLEFTAQDMQWRLKSGFPGWVMIEFSLGNLIGYGEADGIIPGAHQAMLEWWPEFQKGPPPTLVPQPKTMHHSNPCTAVFSYRIPKSPIVRAVVYFGPNTEQDKYMTEIYLALPESQSALANLIIKTFRSRFEPCTAAKVPKT